MNPFLESTCRWFGPYSCETASLTDLMVMFFSIVLSVIAAIWLMSRIGVVLQRR